MTYSPGVSAEEHRGIRKSGQRANEGGSTPHRGTKRVTVR